MRELTIRLSNCVVDVALAQLRDKYPDKTGTQLYEMLKRIEPKFIAIVKEVERLIENRIEQVIGR